MGYVGLSGLRGGATWGAEQSGTEGKLGGS